MKITLINHSDTLGGASVVTYRLMEALRRHGSDARMLVGTKRSSSPFVVEAASHFRTRLPFYAEHLRIFAGNGFSRRSLFQVSIASDGLPLSRHPLVADADAVILNWINQGMLSLAEIGRIAQAKPTLWTMHDQWNLTGICHHTGGCDRFRTHCGRCPYLGWMGGDNDLSANTFSRKARLYGDVPITLVAISRWLEQRARQSVLLGTSPASKARLATIPNAFPVEEFAAPTIMSHASLGLPHDKKLIVFCAARIDDPGKGLPQAIELLNGIADSHGADTCAVFIGACRRPEALAPLRLPHVLLGPVDPAAMPAVMQHAAAVLSTSPFETWGATLVEAQAAGATPVCYVHDGRADIVADGETGYALTGNAEADIQALRNALDRPIAPERLREAARRFDADTVAARYLQLLSAAR